MDEQKTCYNGNIILLGSSYVGKSNMMNQFLRGQFEEVYLATIGINCLNKLFIFDGKKVKINYYDTAGQERYNSLNLTFLRKADGVILVYDITSQESFRKIDFWIQELHNKSRESKVLMLVGNKTDLDNEREVSFQQGEKKANEIGCPFMETSAKTNHNIKECFEKASRVLYLKKSEGDSDPHDEPGSFILDSQKEKKGGCCSDKKK